MDAPLAAPHSGVPAATTTTAATASPASSADDGAGFRDLLLREFRPRSDEARHAVEAAVQTLAERARADAPARGPDVFRTVEAMIAEIDRRLSAQVNLILHEPRFTRLEGAWRGLRHLVDHAGSDAMLRIRVLNAGKAELHRTLRRYKGAAWDQSPLFRKVYEEEYGQLGGTPYGCLVGDYHFDHGPADVDLLGEISRIAAAAHAPFIAGAAPSVLQMDSWRELANPRELSRIVENSEYAGWRALRASEDSRYLALAMPRFLARLPWGPDTQPVEAFGFVEDVEGPDHDRYVWANSAYAMAANVARAFEAHGWCTTIRGVESGGAVPGLPVHAFPTDEGGTDLKCPTEIAISDRREAELAGCGFMPLVHRKHSDFAAFIGAQSLHQPPEYDDPDASANARLAARLPYLFASCRFAHYLKCMVRDKVGSFASAADMQRYLGDWIGRYVISNPESAGQALQAQKPLSAAEVLVEEIEGHPGHYRSTFSLRPHYQLEGMTVSLRLVSRLPSRQAA